MRQRRRRDVVRLTAEIGYRTGIDRVAVVTGGAQGFGQAIAIGLAGAGYQVVSVDLTESSATVEAIVGSGGHAVGVVADVSDPNATERLGRKFEREFGRVDVLVNNAGIFPKAPFDDVDYEFWRRVISTNLDSQFLMVKAVLPVMKPLGEGRIINLTSNSIGLTVPNLTAYTASKLGIIGFTRALSVDLAGVGITVNAVGPTASRTPGGLGNLDEEQLNAVADRQAIKRVGVADDIVGTVVFLAGQGSAFVTGQTIMVDGGLVRL